MSENLREIEARGQDVEAAIESGLATLGISRNDVIIEVVEEGSRGLLGIGSREAVVRLTAMTMPQPQRPATPAPPPAREETAGTGAETPAPSAVTDAEKREREKESAIEIIQALLHKMQVEATITASLSAPDDITGKRINVIEINGDDLGVLIGPRGETLNAIQYISRLMVGHKLRQRSNFVVDVQGYRQRREQALSRMAERMAKKVATRKRPLSLEPMPPYERRIIHMALRDYEDVYTQSTGEGKRRKVRILPK